LDVSGAAADRRLRARGVVIAAGFVLNPAGLAELFASTTGPIALDLSRRAIRVESQAKLNASHPAPSVRGSGPAVRSGRLRSSIAWSLATDALGLYAQIGTTVIYSYRVEVEYDRPYLRPALSAAG
jgi:hypothetical protein